MKTKEFIKRVEELGFEAWISGSIAYVLKDGRYEVARIKTKRACAIDFFYLLNETLDKEISEKLFDIIVEYAKAPVDEREEEKFYFEHKLLKSRKGKPVYLALKCKRGKEFLTVQGSKEDIDNNKVHFTREEIESIKERFDTDLAEFEEIEVKDE